MLLVDFIKQNTNWEAILSNEPYNIKISRDNGYVMFKYNQLSSDFNNLIVQECRGCILREADWKIVCHPFNKFGNYGESYCPEINWAEASVQEKVDGSLMKVWFDNGWHISTNGTIDAFKAELESIKYDSFGKLFLAAVKNNINDEHKFFDLLDTNYTYMFELVSPYNRVVIPYGTEDIYYLGRRNNFTDAEEMIDGTVLTTVIKTPKRYPLRTLEDVKNAANILGWDEEGFVVCDNHFNRVKIKSPEYVKAHFARNNSVITYEKLLEVILASEKAEFLIYASDFKEELEKVEKARDEMISTIKNTISEMNPTSFASRKEFAEAVMRREAWLRPFLFKYDNIDEFIEKINASKWIDYMKQAGYLE